MLIETHPEFSYKAFLFKAICEAKTADLKVSYETLLRSEAHFPESKELLKMRGKTEAELGLFGKARKTFKKLSELDPKDASVMLAYCDLLLLASKHHKCIAICEAARSRFPAQLIEWTKRVVKCHLALNEYSKADAALNSVW